MPKAYFTFCLFAWAIGFLLVVNGCGQRETTYKNPAYNIQIKYPSNWTVKENLEGVIALFAAPQDSALDSFNENLNIVIQDLRHRPMGMQEYSIMAVNQLKVMYREVQIEKLDSFIMGGRPAARLEYIAKVQINVKVVQAWVILNKKAYLVTFSADLEKYDKYKATLNRMLDSFTIFE